MKKRWVLSAILTAGACLAQQGDPWRWTHPDTKMVLGVDWKAAKSSVVGQMLAKKLAQGEESGSKAQKGMEFLKSVDRILITSPSAEGPEGKAGEGPVLIYFEGLIDRDKLKRTFAEGTGVERFRGLDLLVPPRKPGEKGSNFVAALLGDTAAVLGDRASVEQAIDGAAGMKDAALRARALKLAEECEIYMVAAALPQQKGKGPSAMEDMQSMDMGVSLKSGVGLRLNMGFKDSEKAKGMAMMAQLLMSMMASNAKPEQAGLASLAKRLNVETQGANVLMRMDIPPEEVEKGLAQMKGGIEEMGQKAAATILGGSPSGAPGSAAAPKPAQPGSIRIYGMEGGPVEIPLDSTKKKQD